LRLAELNPRWFAEEGRHGQGVLFDCPSCRLGRCAGKPCRLAVAFAPPLDGGTPFPIKKMETLFEALKDPDGEWPGNVVPPGVVWGRTGDTFEALTLSPSVDASAAGHWHGFVQNGDVQ
jgi:hypothetical protein